MFHRDKLKSKEAWIEFYDNRFQDLIARGIDPIKAYSELQMLSHAELLKKREYLKKKRHKLFPVATGAFVAPIPGAGAGNVGFTGYCFATKSLLHFGLIDASYNRDVVYSVVKDVFVDELLDVILGEVPLLNVILAAHGAKSIVNKIVDKLYETALKDHQVMLSNMVAY